MARLPSIFDFCLDLGTATYRNTAVSKAGNHSGGTCRCDDIAYLLLFSMDARDFFAVVP